MKFNVTRQEFEAADVNKALSDILASGQFARSPKMSAFLKYVVMQALCGEAHTIKAYTVGVEALDKLASFDPLTDTSVRTLAKMTLEEFIADPPIPHGAELVNG